MECKRGLGEEVSELTIRSYKTHRAALAAGFFIKDLGVEGETKVNWGGGLGRSAPAR